MGFGENKALLTLLFVGVLMGAVDLALIGPALPAIQAEFDMDQRQLAILFNAYVLCQMIGTPLLAKMADRFGARAIYIFSITLFAAGSLLLAIAGDITSLYIGRSVQGFGSGGILPVAAAVIGTRLPKKEQGPALGILGSVFGLAFLIGPVLGGIFLRYAWQWLFLINLPIAALLILGAIKLLPATRQTQSSPLDLWGAVLLTVVLTALVLGINGIDTGALLASLSNIAVAAPLLIFAIATPIFWRLEKSAADPIIGPHFFRSKQIVLACLIAAGVGALQAGGIFAPALAVSAIGVSQSDAAWLMLPGVVAATIGSPIAGSLINYVGTRTVIFVSLALVLISVLMYGLIEMTVFMFVTAGIINGMGMTGLLGAPLRFIVLAESSPDQQASAQGLLSVITSVGRLLGAAIVGSIATSAGGGSVGYQAGFVGMAVLAAVITASSFALRSRTRELAAEQKSADVPAM